MNYGGFNSFGQRTRRKVFVSYHNKDQAYRDRWDTLFGHLFISKSVGEGDIPDDVSAEYVDRLIREDYITGASVVVVLVGPDTYCRKHVDWEIAAGLNPKVGGLSGLVGFTLPHHPDYWMYSVNDLPARLDDNLASGFANLYRWSEEPGTVLQAVETAFANRISRAHLARNGRRQLARNLC